MAYKKNTAVVGFPFGLVSASDGSAITTGTVSGFYLLDGGSQSAIAGTPTHEGNGQWSVPLTAAEMNGDVVGLLFTHASAIPVSHTLTTTESLVADIVQGVWDEILTAATHNIPGSAGRRVRDIASDIVFTGAVVSATANTLTLEAGASDADGSYDPSEVIITEGTGSGQVRGVLEYFGSLGGNGNPGRTLIVDRDWKFLPDATSKVTIVAKDGRISTNEGQLCDGSTTTAELNSLAPTVSGLLVGQTIQFRSGTGQDQATLIDSYDGPTRTASFPALSLAVDDTTGYQILPVGAPTAAQNRAEIDANSLRLEIAAAWAKNKHVETAPGSNIFIVYKDDGATPLFSYHVAKEPNTKTPV